MPLIKELGAIGGLQTRARVFPVASELYLQGDVCFTYFIILDGWIALSVLLDDGSCQILDFALRGSILGFQATPNAPMDHSARCLSAVRVYAFPKHKLDAIIETNPRVAVLVCRELIVERARAHDHLANIGLRDARQRIARFLLELYVRVCHRFPMEHGETIVLPLSQGMIGEALGLTYVHVCRTLQTLREQKILYFANRKLEIIDPASLMATAGIEHEIPECREQQHVGRPTSTQPVSFPSELEAANLLPARWILVKKARPSCRPNPINLTMASVERAGR